MLAPPGNPESNGQAENGVKTVKTNIKTRLLDPRNKDKKNLERAQKRQIKQHGGRRRSFREKERVFVTDYRSQNHRSWTKAVIHKIIGRTTYLCEIESGQIWKRHANQIISRTLDKETPKELGKDRRGLQSRGVENQVTIKTRYCYHGPQKDSPSGKRPMNDNIVSLPSSLNVSGCSEDSQMSLILGSDKTPENSHPSFVDANSSFSTDSQIERPESVVDDSFNEVDNVDTEAGIPNSIKICKDTKDRANTSTPGDLAQGLRRSVVMEEILRNQHGEKTTRLRLTNELISLNKKKEESEISLQLGKPNRTSNTAGPTARILRQPARVPVGRVGPYHEL
ncbi:unnamed protein product [Ceutorhynchus assimilis]|uniref:Uncharacterized protein n=1 Tax=Ceutorhynchus assimilis TaxID=467358 RepID=A0A9N9MK56_9CUCU|nr:unnamed protein product [Ceutorhynchus assimilis]